MCSRHLSRLPGRSDNERECDWSWQSNRGETQEGSGKVARALCVCRSPCLEHIGMPQCTGWHGYQHCGQHPAPLLGPRGSWGPCAGGVTITAFLKDHFGFNVKNDLERGKQECRLQRYVGGKTNSTWKLSGSRRDR